STIEATCSRLQPLPWQFSFLASVYGQRAGTPLLGSELCSYGGRGFGRAFEPSQFVADNCLEILGELRFDVPPFFDVGTQLYAFADRGWLHNIAPDVGTPANVDRASAGGGVRFFWRSWLPADISAAKAVVRPR